ncbi:hypothetical protein PROFUN_13763 [Planoprotostelium fungivorum]|uniref:Uncharacterized protein n=1 Tax=Planoprotostelium fungivorum TaxID=1890364 RepID=A0A2P6N332_9EUKA|nr:hypothetical protein PROFUN_13763 [Planoprotostelium fungivorum]
MQTQRKAAPAITGLSCTAISPLGQVGVRDTSIHHSDSDRCADSNSEREKW